MAQIPSTTLTQPLPTLLPRERVEEQAQRLGVVMRKRTVDVYALVWTLVLGFQVGSRRSIAALHWAYQKARGHYLGRSSFYERFTPKRASLLQGLALEALASLGPASGLAPQLLSSFRELLAMDATVVRLHALLSKAYAACRTTHTRAAAKLPPPVPHRFAHAFDPP